MATSPGEGVPVSGGNGHKRAQIKLRLPESLAGGVYANSMMVHHTATEFILDFAMVVGETGTVVSRVITSPAHAKKIVAALKDNVAKYEATFGPLRAHDSRDRSPEEG